MESLTVESEKSLTSQEPDSHHGAGSTAEHLQGELTPDLSRWTSSGGDHVSAATPRLLSPFRPRLWSSSGLDRCASDSAAGVLSRQPADQERQCGGEMVFRLSVAQQAAVGSDRTSSSLCATDGRFEPQLRGVGSLRQPPGPPGGQVPRPVSQQCGALLPVHPAHHHPVSHEDQDPEGSSSPQVAPSCPVCWRLCVSLTVSPHRS